MSTAALPPVNDGRKPVVQNRIKVQIGDKVRCVASHSVGYTKGKEYEVFGRNGVKYLKADDGFEDYWTMLVSEFERIEDE